MTHDRMTECEGKAIFLEGGEKIRRWKVISVSSLTSGASNDIRCMHCHGAIRVHKKQVDRGPIDHVEHRSKQDSEHCKAGHYFNGNHKRSSQPVS